ncbi:YveK family protein [Romboutsia sp.]|uniref:YveK family protein n=1 Tax=Romboutsia sp. TaxID=1965302 RepID=UPI003F2B10C6
MNDTIDLKEYIYIIKSKLVNIILFSLICVFISGVISYYVIKPVYEVSTTLIVDTNRSDSISNLTGDNIDVTERLALTYGEIIKSRTVLEQIINKLNLKVSYEKLSKEINISVVEGTQIINIKVQDTDKKRAAEIANSIPGVFSGEAQRLVKANGIEVVDTAIIPQYPIKPNHIINMLLAAIFGIILSTFIEIIRAYSSSKVKTPLDIREILEWPLLGVIPNELEKCKKGKRGRDNNCRS